MKKFIFATIASVAFAGAAIAQEAPILYGDVSPSVENSVGNSQVFNGEATGVPGLDMMSTASVEADRGDGRITLEDVTNPTANDNISGK